MLRYAPIFRNIFWNLLRKLDKRMKHKKEQYRSVIVKEDVALRVELFRELGML